LGKVLYFKNIVLVLTRSENVSDKICITCWNSPHVICTFLQLSLYLLWVQIF